jgi:Asp-tRNA(Asn)/Glu-tRNA(Gln) amidotransferase B subunit
MKQACIQLDPEPILRQLIQDYPDKFEHARDKQMLRGWFVGRAMQVSKGTLNPIVVNDVLNTIYKETISG